jgi:hypothetical protein
VYIPGEGGARADEGRSAHGEHGTDEDDAAVRSRMCAPPRYRGTRKDVSMRHAAMLAEFSIF